MGSQYLNKGNYCEFSYIRFTENKIVQTVLVGSDAAADLDVNGEVVGIEFFSPLRTLDNLDGDTLEKKISPSVQFPLGSSDEL